MTLVFEKTVPAETDALASGYIAKHNKKQVKVRMTLPVCKTFK